VGKRRSLTKGGAGLAKRSNQKDRTQARGRARRELLILAARELLDEQPIEEISLADIAERAGIPTGSAYHFFPSTLALFEALVVHFEDEIEAATSSSYTLSTDATWQDLIHDVIDRGVELYRANPAFSQLIISGKAPPEIKLADRLHDGQLGQIIMDAVNRHFVLPEIPRGKELFTYAVEIADLFFMISMQRHGKIADAEVTEAKRAVCAYLRVYLPTELIRREHATT
jgi:AcrR family transcriptional regulator